MAGFTPYSALIGGALIGLAAALLLWLNGRIAGVSGIAAGLIAPARGELAWRAAFVLGLVTGAAVYRLAGGPLEAIAITPSWPVLVAGGLLVGFGTRIGNGCTSGHGVCGLARLSLRSLAATTVFLGFGIATVFVVRHVIGGA